MRVCTGLEMVDMSYSCGFGDREAAAVSNCAELKEVRLDKCLGVSDVGLARIVVGCGRLERLSLKWCLQVSDLGVELLCKKCFDLRVLDLSYLKVCSPRLCCFVCLFSYTLCNLEALFNDKFRKINLIR